MGSSGVGGRRSRTTAKGSLFRERRGQMYDECTGNLVAGEVVFIGGVGLFVFPPPRGGEEGRREDGI